MTTILGGVRFWLAASLFRAAACWVMLAGASVVSHAAPGPFSHQRIGVANGCFVEAVALGDAVRERTGGAGWYRLLQWGAKEADEVVAGHAVMIFEHGGKLWSYDVNYGFTALGVPVERREDVEAVAKIVTAPYVGKITPRYPLYREDFPQAPEAKAPAVAEGVEDRDLRDAQLVATRLAKHRPVALVEFSYPKDGATVRSAAVAFIYNGRLCVYSSQTGTVPFRAQALSVKNLRQLQELLRRAYPGASGLKVR